MTRLHEPVDAAKLLAGYQRRVDLIEQCANEASKTEFQRKWRVVLERCATWFSSMPLNPDIYREPGGAFRCTVETAFYAMRLAGGQKFGTNLPSEKRRRIEPQYNYAVFLAAVCSKLDEPYRHFAIERESDRAVWNPSVHGAAGPWMGRAPYRVVRRAAPLPAERMRTGMLAQMLVGAELLTGLDAEVLAELVGAINPNPMPHDESLLHKVIRQAVETAAEFDRKAQRAVFEPVQFAVPSAVHVAAQLQPVAASAAAAPMSASASVAGSAAVSGSVTATGPVSPNAPAPAPSGGAQVGAAAPVCSTSDLAGAPPVRASALPLNGTGGPNQAGAPPRPPAAGQEARSLFEAIGLGQASAENLAATSFPSAAASAAESVAAVNPADMRPPSAARAAALAGGAGHVPEDAAVAIFDEVLKGTPNIIKELFRALREDVVSGVAKVAWTDRGLVIPKRLIGSYGVASDTLVEHLRKRSLLVGNEQGEITLGPRAGQLIMDRPA